MLLALVLLSHAAFHMGPARPATLAPHRMPACTACEFEALAVKVQVSLEDGESEFVTLDATNTPAECAADLASRFGLSEVQRQELEADLVAQWEDASANAPPIYVGPMCEDNELQGLVCSLELESVGLALEVADSVAVPNGGRGLFVRCLGETESVTLDEGTAVCGYAAGAMRTSADSEGGRSVGFALANLESVVWFEQELHAIGDLLADDSIDGIAGHVAEFDPASKQPIRIAIDPSYDGPRYFVPDEEQPDALHIGAIGQMANDLAISDADEEPPASAALRQSRTAQYEEASGNCNLLVLAFRLERDEGDPRILVPTRPITTLAKSVTFVNDVPMELGCHYGHRYCAQP